MTPAIALFILGAILLRAGWKNQSLVDSALGRNTHRDTGNVPTFSGGDFGADPSSGGTTSGNMEAEMDRMISLKHPYKWGGGHAEFDQDGPWDCSGAVSWLLHYMGLLNGRPMVSGEFMAHGKAGRGATFTVYANPGHVFIKMESGPRAGKCWGTTRRLRSQGGSLAWHDHTTVGFVARHYSLVSADPTPGDTSSSPRRRLP